MTEPAEQQSTHSFRQELSFANCNLFSCLSKRGRLIQRDLNNARKLARDTDMVRIAQQILRKLGETQCIESKYNSACPVFLWVFLRK